jgi:hypothetical protein
MRDGLLFGLEDARHSARRIAVLGKIAVAEATLYAHSDEDVHKM